MLELSLQDNSQAIGRIIPKEGGKEGCQRNKGFYAHDIDDARALLPSDIHRPKWLRQHYDHINDRFLFFNQPLSFDIADNNWPIDAWIVEVKTQYAEEISIPAGPWVRSYGFINRITGFPCGPQCYTDASAYYIDDTIYMHIKGSFVKNNTQGFYRLLREENKWEKLLNGDLDSFPFLYPRFSHDGCKLLHKQNNKYAITNLCITDRL